MSIKYLPVYYIGHLTQTLLQMHPESINWLPNTLPSESKRAQVQLSTQEFDVLLTRCFNLQHLQDLGIQLGARLQIGHHGAFGLAILNASTARDIVYFVQEYIGIRIPYIELTVVEEGDELVILVHDHHWHGNSHRFVIEAVSMAMINLFLVLKQRDNHLSIARLFFDFEAPEYVEKYKVFAPAKLTFNQAFSGMALRKNLLDQPLNGSDELSFQQAVQLCDQEKMQHTSLLSTSGQVRQILLNQTEGLANLERIAQQLAISARTLHRELQRENTSFKKITDQVNAKKAKQYLLANNMRVQQIATRLGYSDTANFRRAFKRWFGCSPNEYKQRNQMRN